MKIRISYHIVAQGGWEELTKNCIDKMIRSGLWDKADEIHMMCHYSPELFSEFKNDYSSDKITWHLFTNSVVKRGESYTNDKLKEICDADTEEWAVLRLHNKSSNYTNHPEQLIAYKWRDLIEYWSIERWELLVSQLEKGFDVAGNEWMEEPWPHNSGNVWWSKSTYIRKLPRLALPVHEYSPAAIDLKGWQPRHEAEAWVGLAGAKGWSALPELTSWGHPGIGEGWNDFTIPFNDREQKLKIALINLHTPNYQTMADLSVPGKEQYAKKHGYMFFNKTDNFVPDIPIGYQKCYFLADLMLEHPDIEWFWHSGTDCIITNHNIKLESLIDPTVHFIVCKDGQGINADVFFIRNSTEGREYIEHLKTYHVTSGTEQGQMWDDEHNPKWRAITKYLPQQTMNAYDLTWYPHMSGTDRLGGRSAWQPGDFVLQAVTGLNDGWTAEQIYQWKLNILQSNMLAIRN
jgi:hypothetical protein